MNKKDRMQIKNIEKKRNVYINKGMKRRIKVDKNYMLIIIIE